MSLAKNFNGVLHKQLEIYAAWYPVANTFKLGDFGLIEGGVFRRLGSLSEFDVEFEGKSGPPALIDFMSAGGSVIRTVAGVEVPSLEKVGDVEAKLTFYFERENACVIKARLDVLEMQNIYHIARQIAKHPDWEKRFKVVWAVYTGEQCVIIATAEAKTKVEFSGKIDVLRQIELGKVEVKPSVESSSERVFKSVGRSGVVGLGLFKLGWFDRVKVLGDEEVEPEQDIKLEQNWGEDLPDDL